MVVISQDIPFRSREFGAVVPFTGSFPRESRLSLPVREVPEERLTPVRPVPYAAAKRTFDVILSLVFLAVLAPLFASIALLVKLTSEGPVIFKQTRVGEGGRTFTFYKFRSMYADAEARKAQLMALNEASGPVFKMKNDPRITPIGRVLRKFSLDELPQFFNVLRGDMSFVGPRPPIPSEVAQYGPWERQRLSVRPGLTCLWQISGRSDVQFDEWVELDLQYINTMNFWGDVKLVAQTVPAVLAARGAR